MNFNRRSSPPNHRYFVQGWFPLGILGFEAELRALQDYLRLVEQHVATDAAQFAAYVDATVKSQCLAGEELDAFYDGHREEYDRLHHSYPSLARASVLTLTCSRVESILTDICKELEDSSEVSTPHQWTSLGRERGIRRAAAFLRQNFDIRLTSYRSWSTIAAYFRVRDCFVHAGGEILLMSDGSEATPDHQAAVRQAIAKLGGASESALHRLQLRPEFFDALFVTLTGFSEALVDAFRDNAVVGPVYWK